MAFNPNPSKPIQTYSQHKYWKCILSQSISNRIEDYIDCTNRQVYTEITLMFGNNTAVESQRKHFIWQEYSQRLLFQDFYVANAFSIGLQLPETEEDWLSRALPFTGLLCASLQLCVILCRSVPFCGAQPLRGSQRKPWKSVRLVDSITKIQLFSTFEPNVSKHISRFVSISYVLKSLSKF